MCPAADLEVAEVLLSQLYFFLHPLQLVSGKAGADTVMCLAGALVGGGVEEEVVRLPIAIHGPLDLLPGLLGLLHPPQSLQQQERCTVR